MENFIFYDEIDMKNLYNTCNIFRCKQNDYVPFKNINIIANYLKNNIRKIKTINTRNSSYGLKHIIENVLGKEVDHYVSNGELILSALLAGFKMDNSRINPYFNMSKKDINRLSDLGRLKRNL